MGMKIFSNKLQKLQEHMTLQSMLKQEWFVFLSINVFFPFAALVFLLISREQTFRLVSVLTVAALILVANIHRIAKGKKLKKLYIVICFLNVLSFPFASGLSFSTTIETWILNISTLYEMTLGDGYGYGWPYEIS